MACSCKACLAAVKPGRRFVRVVRMTAERMALNLKGPAKRHKRLTVWLWASRRVGQPVAKGKVFHEICNIALHLLAEGDIENRPEKKVRHIQGWLGERLDIPLCLNCHLDSNECGCWQCSGCSEWFKQDDEASCAVCHVCSSCCGCEICGHCGSRCHSGDICEDCNRCRDSCCRCDEDRRRGIPFRDVLGGKLTFHGDPTDRFPRFVGTEIECIAERNKFAALKQVQEKWNMANHRDGSISSDAGMEVCTAPAQGKDFEAQVIEVCKALTECEATVDVSCGLHVHVEAKDLTAKNVLALVRLYHMVEPALYQIVSPSRRTGSFSQEWGTHFKDAGVFDPRSGREKRVAALEGALYGSKEQVKHMKENPRKHDSRYHGLNLNALLLYGTVEFRLHQGTVNARKIIMWSAVCASLVEYATKHTEKEISWMENSPMEILKKVVGDEEVVTWIEARRAFFRVSDRLNAKCKSVEHPEVVNTEASEEA
jgi:hypothetical protein